MKEDSNFALIVVGVVAVVAIIGLLNFNTISGKGIASHSKSEIISDTGMVYCAPDCNDKCAKSNCIGIKTGAGAGTSYCSHNLLYDAEGTYYMHYYCG